MKGFIKRHLVIIIKNSIMKKLILLAYIGLTSLLFFPTKHVGASPSTNLLDTNVFTSHVDGDIIGVIERPVIDSTTIQQIGDIGLDIAVNANGGNDLIKGVPNVFIHSIGALILGLFIRFFEKRRLRKRGKLLDKNAPPNI
jgi:hypothetical protein